MTLTKREFLIAGSAAFVTTTIASPVFAADPPRLGLGAIIIVGAIVAGRGGGKVDIQDIMTAAINKAEPRDKPVALGKELEARLTKDFPEIQFHGAIVKAVQRAYAEGLDVGETHIKAASRDQKWSAEFTLSLKPK